MLQNLQREVSKPQAAHSLQLFIALLLLIAEGGLGIGEEEYTGIERHVLRRLFLAADDHSGGDNSLGCHAIGQRVLLRLATASPQSLEKGNLPDVEVVLVLIEHHQRIDRLGHSVVHGRNGSHSHVGRFHIVQEKSLQTGGQRSFTRTFLSEQVQDGKVTGTLVDHIPEKCGHEVAESNSGHSLQRLRSAFR